MKKLISFLFGNSDTESKVLIFYYRFGIAFYFLGLILLLFQAIATGEWFPLMFGAILYPILFRVNYLFIKKFNTNKGEKRFKKRYILIPVGIVLIINVIIFAVILLSPGGNVSINASKTYVDGDVSVSIGSLKGNHEVEVLDVTRGGLFSIPYDASVKEGTFTLLIVSADDQDKPVWSEEISATKNDVMEFEVDEGEYKILLETEEAKNITLNVQLNQIN
ncbi:hypothetical protein [Bacillus weihaiensis]|uniref:Uncharacterized protein n=1 Tax=Bacillus weihaiensis TaxID=1547283 RepID=A0A1L3MRJ5_9BACI|nr:hypothetical protein [Bacillus weihaiensis]APH04956.1 hypothetical protein A9C19_09445 [Bacillus weihaiensis]